ncbi:MAG TPA: low temperature requirement protein A [Actinomycetota bacterium]|jgi:low temperature requirement protein LtrA|nr:low temperature requirement protein A [Actinomycetota bacterium]
MRADQVDGSEAPGPAGGAWYRPMVARSTDEEHRSATVLELFFDLCFVVAVAQAASALHHEVAADHVGEGVVGYVSLFFAIWWAWMNFTWFASAYDTDDVPYRLTTLVQIAGALILAAGVPEAMDGDNFAAITVGYVVMRLAMVTQWLRAAQTDPPHRRSSLRFAAGIAVVQVGWVLRLLLPVGLGQAGFLVLAAAELAVPVWAERAAPTTWHPRHIAERYGLFTLIVLGECVLSSTLAIESALREDAALADLATTAAGGLLTVFGMWWLYFAKESARFLTSLRAGIVWGYGHYLVFGSAAAVGAGLAVNVDFLTHHAAIGPRVAAAAFTIPVALFLVAVWALQLRPHHLGRWRSGLVPGSALLVLAATLTAEPVLVTGLLVAAMITTSVVVPGRAAA